jgi:hypothetical protein
MVNAVKIDGPTSSFSPEQLQLWARVTDLWALSLNRDVAEIRSTLHPDYVGWDMNSPEPHDREFAALSVCGDSPEVVDYELRPLSVRVYQGVAGVVHYSYRATVVPSDAAGQVVTGRWTEVYLNQEGAWIMIAVSGRPDPA